MIVAAAEGAGDVLLDDHTSAEAKRIYDRLLKQIESGFVEFATVEGLEEPHAQALFEDAARIILAAPPSAREWTLGQFEPELVAKVYLERVAASLADFEPEGRCFITLIIVDYHKLLASDSINPYVFVTSTAERRALLQSDRMAQLLVDVLVEIRRKGGFSCMNL